MPETPKTLVYKVAKETRDGFPMFARVVEVEDGFGIQIIPHTGSRYMALDAVYDYSTMEEAEQGLREMAEKEGWTLEK